MGGRVAVISTSLKGLITSFDKAAEQMLGYRAQGVIGSRRRYLFHEKDELIKRAEALCRAAQIQMSFDTIVASVRPGYPVKANGPMFIERGTHTHYLVGQCATR
jgi:PAS domain-containing protein